MMRKRGREPRTCEIFKPPKNIVLVDEKKRNRGKVDTLFGKGRGERQFAPIHLANPGGVLQEKESASAHRD